jgi:hypothetical protein
MVRSSLEALAAREAVRARVKKEKKIYPLIEFMVLL